jgi:hypothetical protein
MNANELRLGNLVLYSNDSMQCKITEIDGLGMSVEVLATYEITWIELDQFEPIHLSPEILGKCGFVLNRNNELSIEINDIASHLELMRGVDGFYYPSFTQTPQGDEERTVYFNRINSLHQIQNLYFSLCGEELNYKQ